MSSNIIFVLLNIKTCTLYTVHNASARANGGSYHSGTHYFFTSGLPGRLN